MSVQKTTQPVARNNTTLPTLPKGIQLERAPAPLPLAGLPKSINVQRTTTASTTTKINAESGTSSTWVPPKLPSGISVTQPAAGQVVPPNLPKSITISKGPPRIVSASSSESPASGSSNSGLGFWMVLRLKLTIHNCL
jgi:hypothetical protein